MAVLNSGVLMRRLYQGVEPIKIIEEYRLELWKGVEFIQQLKNSEVYYNCCIMVCFMGVVISTDGTNRGMQVFYEAESY